MSVYEPWNRTDLKCPPRFTVATQLRPSDVEKVQDMRLVMNEALSTLSGLKIFRKEHALLSRFLYKYKRAFRHEKGVQHLSKMHQAIIRYESVDMPRVFVNFLECIPCNITWTTTESYLPTRQMLKWVLFRILVVAKLMTRIIEMSEEAGKYLFGRLRLGWSGHYMIFAIAVTGRIMSCAKYVLLSAIGWYRRLYRYISLLIETGRFVPSFRFPRRIEDVIGNLDLEPPSRRENLDSMFELIDLTVEENREKRPEQEDDVVVTNQIFFRTGASNINRENLQAAGREWRNRRNHSNEGMTSMFEGRKIVRRSLLPGASSELAKPIPSVSGLSPNLNLPSTSTGGPTSCECAIGASAPRILDNSSSDDSDCETQPPEIHNRDVETPLIRLDRQPKKKSSSGHFKNGTPRK